MKKICVIDQPAGIGDIFFTQKIAKKYVDLGYKIVWPVINEFKFLNDYMGTSEIEYCVNCGNEYDLKIILDKSEQIFPNKKIMTAKYFRYDIDFTDWIDYFSFERNYEKENMLFKKLTFEEPFVLINKKFGSPPNFAIKNGVEKTIINKNLRIVEMDFVEHFTLFDWCTILEKAEEIHSVDTSINYLIEKLELGNEKIFMYPRLGSETVFQLEGIFKTKWNWVL